MESHKSNKAIFHMDGDAFFVGVEVAKDPTLRGRPVVTGAERGIVSALSYEAKALGITRGMYIYRVKKDFKKVIVLPGDYRSYARYSDMMFSIVRRYADGIEEYSIDECFADLTGLDKMQNMTCRQIAEQIKKEIWEELGLTVSIGIAPSKCLAKVASKWQKPNGLTVITHASIDSYLAKTPIEKIWGIGRRTALLLQKNRIYTAKDFIDKDISWIERNMSKPYETIWRELRGESIMDIDTESKSTYASIQKTESFAHTSDRSFLLSELSRHVEDSCIKARHYDLSTKKVSFFLKTTDFKFSTFVINLEDYVNTPEIILGRINKNFDKVYNELILYRTTGVTLHDLREGGNVQQDLFGGNKNRDKYKKIYEEIDALDEKFGRHTVYLASTHKSLKKNKKGTDIDDLDRDLLFL